MKLLGGLQIKHVKKKGKTEIMLFTLSSCPNKSLETLQLIQNGAACVLTTISMRSCLSILPSLHWLPVRFRI